MALKVKDLEAWMVETRLMYASHGAYRLYVRLHAAPYLERYIIEEKGVEVFKTTKRSDAVRKYNELAF